MTPRARKALGCAVLLAYLTVYVAAAAALGAAFAQALPAWAILVYFAVAGVVWVIPLRAMVRWMQGQAGRN